MIWIVRTTDGVTAQNSDGKNGNLTQEQAEASAEERNRRAEALGIKTRYEAVER